MRATFVTTLALLAIKVAYDGFIAPIVPDRELIGFMPVQVETANGPVVVNRISVTSDKLAFCGLAALALGTVEGFTRKVTPG